MTLEEFIEAAIEGGWNPHPVMQTFEYKDDDGDTAFFVMLRGSLEVSHYSIHLNDIYLDPNAWRAVGKVKGWTMLKTYTIDDLKDKTVWFKKKGDSSIMYIDSWENHMHSMIDALCGGKSIEELIATL